MNERALAKRLAEWSALFMRLAMRDLQRYARGAGLSLPQMHLLVYLHFRGPREVMGFADYMQLSPAGASQMVERLARQGLVERTEAPDDRRVRRVRLTAPGRRVVEESLAARQEWVTRLVRTLSPQERDLLGRALEVLAAKAAELEPGGDEPE